MPNLRKKAIRLAFANSKIRPHILPLLKKAAVPSDFIKRVDRLALQVFEKTRSKSRIPQELLDRELDIRLKNRHFFDDQLYEDLFALKKGTGLMIEGYGPLDLGYLERSQTLSGGLWPGFWKTFFGAIKRLR